MICFFLDLFHAQSSICHFWDWVKLMCSISFSVFLSLPSFFLSLFTSPSPIHSAFPAIFFYSCFYLSYTYLIKILWLEYVIVTYNIFLYIYSDVLILEYKILNSILFTSSHDFTMHIFFLDVAKFFCLYLRHRNGVPHMETHSVFLITGTVSHFFLFLSLGSH